MRLGTLDNASDASRPVSWSPSVRSTPANWRGISLENGDRRSGIVLDNESAQNGSPAGRSIVENSSRRLSPPPPAAANLGKAYSTSIGLAKGARSTRLDNESATGATPGSAGPKRREADSSVRDSRGSTARRQRPRGRLGRCRWNNLRILVNMASIARGFSILGELYKLRAIPQRGECWIRAQIRRES
jgi:hypothetical protein